MVVNMDTELQRLICLSVEKMSREPGSGSRKGRGLDLRKALLVAHVLQDMRSAYITDDYKILFNTVCPELSSENEIENLKRTVLRNGYQDYVSGDAISSRKRKFLSDDWTSGAIERPPRSTSSETSFMTSPYRCPSGTQSCLLTCSDAAVSKISQQTHPVPVSINTSYILSHQTAEKDDLHVDGNIDIDDETPAVSEQVEVTSSNEVDVETIEVETVDCDEMIATETQEHTELSTITVSNVMKSRENLPSTSCPLPRKKRPLPKEFTELQTATTEQSPSKRTKVEDTAVTSSASDVTVTSFAPDVTVTSSSPCCLRNTTTATTLIQSTALSYSGLSLTGTSTCSSATYSVCTTSLVSSTNSKPKVVVEKMHKPLNGTWSSWSLPATCTQPHLSQFLVDGVYRAQLGDISNLRKGSIRSAGLQVAY